MKVMTNQVTVKDTAINKQARAMVRQPTDISTRAATATSAVANPSHGPRDPVNAMAMTGTDKTAAHKARDAHVAGRRWNLNAMAMITGATSSR
jgi:hypothetical protein